MPNNIRYHFATSEDLDFVIEAIVESTKSGTDRISYCGLFSLSEMRFREILKQVVAEDVGGNDFSLTNYLIASIDGNPVGACCAWIEALVGVQSNLLKFNLLFPHLEAEEVQNAKNIAQFVRPLQLNREPFSLQIDSVYVKPEFRGMGLSQKIILEQFRFFSEKNPEITKAQLIVIKPNTGAIRSYEKIGFKVIQEAEANNEVVSKIFPATIFILMEMPLPHHEYALRT